jgi:hypothetical protein
MALDLWFREDVARILIALASAGEQRGDEYRRALVDVALAFGIDPRQMPDGCYPLPAEAWLHPGSR